MGEHGADRQVGRRSATGCRIEPAVGDDYFYRLDTTVSPPALGYGDVFGFDRGVVARSDDGSVVGIVMLIQISPLAFEGAGTWVADDWRRRGIALRMWKRLLAGICRRAEIGLVAVSLEGEALARRVAAIAEPLQIPVSVFNGRFPPSWDEAYVDAQIRTGGGDSCVRRS
jgi:hypothetical protein